jgi:hypothetical protein
LTVRREAGGGLRADLVALDVEFPSSARQDNVVWNGSPGPSAATARLS